MQQNESQTYSLSSPSYTRDVEEEEEAICDVLHYMGTSTDAGAGAGWGVLLEGWGHGHTYVHV